MNKNEIKLTNVYRNQTLYIGNVKRICSLKRLNITKFVNKFNKENITEAGSCRPSSLLNGHYKINIVNGYIHLNTHLILNNIIPSRETVEPANYVPPNPQP